MNSSPPAAPDRSTADLVRDVTEQSSELVRTEIALAKAEITESVKHAGIGIGLFGGSGAIGFYALGAFVAAAILGLATAVDAWLAALIVGTVLIAIAALAALAGKREVTQVEPVPQQARQGVEKDVRTVKEAASN